MKPLSERDENFRKYLLKYPQNLRVGMKPLSERDENLKTRTKSPTSKPQVGMKPLSERDENQTAVLFTNISLNSGRNEATL